MDKSAAAHHLSIAPGVVETIVSVAAATVDGVASVGARQTPRGILSALSKKHQTSGIMMYEEDGEVIVDLRLQVFYGYRLPDIAESVRTAVADALESQADVQVSCVNVTIDAIQFSG